MCARTWKGAVRRTTPSNGRCTVDAIRRSNCEPSSVLTIPEALGVPDAAGPAYTPRWVLDAPWRTTSP